MTRSATGDPDVFDDPERGRYEIDADGRTAGFASYVLVPGRVVVTHTEIDPSEGGHGLGSRLARAILDDIARRGLRVTPVCPFIADYIRRHPDYLDLVDDRHRAQLRATAERETE